MNEKNRVKLLRLRKRADQFELEAIEARRDAQNAIDHARTEIAKMSRERQAEQAKAGLAAQEQRQADARHKTVISRLLEALQSIAPQRALVSNELLPDRWREIAESSMLWEQWQAMQRRGELRPRADVDHEAGVIRLAGYSVKVGQGGTGGTVENLTPLPTGSADAWNRVCLKAFENLPADTAVRLTDVDAILTWCAEDAAAIMARPVTESTTNGTTGLDPAGGAMITRAHLRTDDERRGS